MKGIKFRKNWMDKIPIPSGWILKVNEKKTDNAYQLRNVDGVIYRTDIPRFPLHRGFTKSHYYKKYGKRHWTAKKLDKAYPSRPKKKFQQLQPHTKNNNENIDKYNQI